MNIKVSPDYILQVRGLKKSYGGIKALNGIFFDLRKGEVHALMGENGAGKSTFMKILAGLEKPDSGEIFFEGSPYKPTSVQASLQKGISMIHQELLSVPELTVAQNLFLGKEHTRFGKRWLDENKNRQEAEKWLNKLGIDISPSAKMKSLSVAEMQMVEMAKALSNDAKVIIMDEPTSALSDREADRLFETIRDLQSKGVSIIYISHKMEEIFRIADTITVFRDGRYIESKPADAFDTSSLITAMVGRKLNDIFPDNSAEKGAIIYTVRKLTRKPAFDNITFDLHAGEILGISGLVGAGRTELARVLYGLDRADSGEVWLHGEPLLPDSPQTALKKGIGYVSEDRKTLGLITQLSILKNISLSSIGRYSTYGFVNEKNEKKAVTKLAQQLRIKASSLDQRVETLSGGNQQKVAIAKVLMAKPKVIILDEPTRGIDIGAKIEVYQLIRQLACEGLGVILISSELPEITGLCDRVLVLSQGKQTALLNRSQISPEKIMYHAVPR